MVETTPVFTMADDSQDRNLPASQRKLNRARDEGQVSRSEDLSHFAVIVAGSLGVVLLAPHLFDLLQTHLAQQLSFDASTLSNINTMLTRLGDNSNLAMMSCATFASLIAVAVVAAALISGGWVLTLTPLIPDFSRVNPMSGLGNLFTKRRIVTTAKMLLITTILFVVAGLFLRNGFVSVSVLLLQPSAASIVYLTKWISSGLGMMLLVLLAAALIDVPLQRFLMKEQMKMSREEVREESKAADGNPQIKRRIRQKQREMAQRSSVNKVPKADFVVMNPTHFAVAIK